MMQPIKVRTVCLYHTIVMKCVSTWIDSDLISLADFSVLNAYVFFNDSKVKCAQQFQEFAPTAMRMVNRLTKHVKDADKIDAAVEDALAGQFTPF